jgi:hypothetical protein
MLTGGRMLFLHRIQPVYGGAFDWRDEQLSNFPAHIVTGPDGVFDEQLSNDYRHLITGPDGTRRTYSSL